MIALFSFWVCVAMTMLCVFFAMIAVFDRERGVIGLCIVLGVGYAIPAFALIGAAYP